MGQDDFSTELMRWAAQYPSEIVQSWLIVRAVEGCSYNQCAFCYTYHETGIFNGFRILSLEDVFENIRRTYDHKASIFPPVTFNSRVFIGEGDAFARPTDDLVAILDFLHEFEPLKDTLETVGAYARFDSLLEHDLKRLKTAGLTDLYLGVESGDDEVLRNVNKGYETDVMKRAYNAAKEAGYKCHVFVISGLGGKERTQEHAQKTAEILNEFKPDTIMVSPLTLSAITPLGQRYERGEFADLSFEEKIEEEKRLVRTLEFPADAEISIKLMGCFRCSNVGYQGILPKDKEGLLAWLEHPLCEHYLSCAPEPVGVGHAH